MFFVYYNVKFYFYGLLGQRYAKKVGGKGG